MVQELIAADIFPLWDDLKSDWRNWPTYKSKYLSLNTSIIALWDIFSSHSMEQGSYE